MAHHINRQWKLLITPKEACDAYLRLPGDLKQLFEHELSYGRIGNTERLIQHLKNKDAVILDLEQIHDEVLSACPDLKVISRFGEGCNAIDFKSIKAYRRHVTNTRGVTSIAVARQTIALILALTQKITENDRHLKKGRWIRQPNFPINTATLGVVGYGRIGKLVAKFASSLGFRILIYSRNRSIQDYPQDYSMTHNLADLIMRSHIISLHVPLNAETEQLISKKMIGCLYGKYLINTSRGGLVDESALLQALDHKSVLGYATDVFRNEPIANVSMEIARHERVIATPHVAAYDEETAQQMALRALENTLYALKNEHASVNAYVHQAT